MTHQQLCQKGNKKTAIVFRGDETFDVPPVIEAADTPPFFHNNAVAKLEDAVAFYTTDTFNNSIAGDGPAFVLTKDEINAIGAFLRALNAVENIRSSNAYAQRSIDPEELQPAEELVDLAIAETTDAIEVLTKGPLKLYPTAVAALKDVRAALKRNDIDEAIALQEAARADIVVGRPVTCPQPPDRRPKANSSPTCLHRPAPGACWTTLPGERGISKVCRPIAPLKLDPRAGKGPLVGTSEPTSGVLSNLATGAN
jgi:hypothetical protein